MTPLEQLKYEMEHSNLFEYERKTGYQMWRAVTQRLDYFIAMERRRAEDKIIKENEKGE